MPEFETSYSKTFEKREEFHSFDCLVLIGHSIEEVTTVHGKTEWKPTRLIQELNGKGWRTGVRNLNLDPNEERAYVGGGNAVSIAGAEFFNQLAEDTEISNVELPKLVIFAASRPAYLKERGTPDELTEGIPMAKVFQREIKPRGDYTPEILFLNENKNTRDDIEKPIMLAFERGFHRVAFVMLDIRIERAKEFLNDIFEEHPELRAVEAEFILAEKILEERYTKHPERLKELKKIIDVFKSSKAHAKTLEAEQGGIKALHKKEYKGKGQY